jgi:meiotically up-regulated gene 157 (Mug157) protein
MIVEYQIGVDVLGFPIYFRHEIYKGETNQSKFQPKPRKWLKVIQSIIKQR